MICSFTQTYSNNRNELYEFHNKDINDIYFRNKLDKNYYAFHNSDNEYMSKILNSDYFKQMNNLEVIMYRDISYTESFYKTLQKLKNDGVKYLFFLQDDVFSMESTEVIDALIDYVKNNEFDMLNIEKEYIDLKTQPKNIIYSNNKLTIYDTDSNDFKNIGIWSYDDGPYVARVDYLINNVYDPEYFMKGDIWEAEGYLFRRISDNKIQRYTTNYTIFRRFVIVGKNPGLLRDSELAILNKKFP